MYPTARRGFPTKLWDQGESPGGVKGAERVKKLAKQGGGGGFGQQDYVPAASHCDIGQIILVM